MREMHRAHALEPGALPGTVRSLLDLLASVRTMLDENVPFTERAVREINSLFEKGIELLECLRDALVTENRVLVRHIIGSGVQYAQLATDYAMAHQQRLLTGVCHPRASSVYLEMLEQLKGLEAHVRQIAQQLAVRHASSSLS
jgi:Na+/phosphate symporter